MDTLETSTQNPQLASSKNARKPNKTCVPCGARKIKCDAVTVGLPCSNCTSRQRGEDCVLPVRKRRSGKVIRVTPSLNSKYPEQNGLPGLSESRKEPLGLSARQNPDLSENLTSYPAGCQRPRHADQDLLYLNILNAAVTDKTGTDHQTPRTTPINPSSEYGLISRKFSWSKIARLENISNEFLRQKGVFDLPPLRYLDTLVQIYFDYVHPFSPIISRAEFMSGYQSCSCSFFLLRVILALASIHAPEDVLAACGFTCSSTAQDSFFFTAKLLHDFAAEDDPLILLQGSILLCSVILDRPSDRDFSYWFHNAIHLATKIDLRNKCVREETPRQLRLYRRIWWTLYCLDIFHVFVNPRRSRLLEDTVVIEPRNDDDWDPEDLSVSSHDLLSPITTQQRVFPVMYGELSRIFGQLLTDVKSSPEQDPRHIMHPVDAWRKTLAVKMHVSASTGPDTYYLNLQAMSYRFECILCRLIRSLIQESHHSEWREWAKQRFRSALLELDTIALRVLSSGTLRQFPMPFVTTMTALLALHIESALDPDEKDLVHSMARISVSQIMLLLNQGKDIPALKRALPVFEGILAKNNLYPAPHKPRNEVDTHSQSQSTASLAQVYTLPDPHDDSNPSRSEQSQGQLPSYGDMLGLDLLDDWTSLVDVGMFSQDWMQWGESPFQTHTLFPRRPSNTSLNVRTFD